MTIPKPGVPADTPPLPSPRGRSRSVSPIRTDKPRERRGSVALEVRADSMKALAEAVAAAEPCPEVVGFDNRGWLVDGMFIDLDVLRLVSQSTAENQVQTMKVGGEEAGVRVEYNPQTRELTLSRPRNELHGEPRERTVLVLSEDTKSVCSMHAFLDLPGQPPTALDITSQQLTALAPPCSPWLAEVMQPHLQEMCRKNLEKAFGRRGAGAVPPLRDNKSLDAAAPVEPGKTGAVDCTVANKRPLAATVHAEGGALLVLKTWSSRKRGGGIAPPESFQSSLQQLHLLNLDPRHADTVRTVAALARVLPRQGDGLSAVATILAVDPEAAMAAVRGAQNARVRVDTVHLFAKEDAPYGIALLPVGTLHLVGSARDQTGVDQMTQLTGKSMMNADAQRRIESKNASIVNPGNARGLASNLAWHSGMYTRAEGEQFILAAKQLDENRELVKVWLLLGDEHVTDEALEPYLKNLRAAGPVEMGLYGSSYQSALRVAAAVQGAGVALHSWYVNPQGCGVLQLPDGTVQVGNAAALNLRVVPARTANEDVKAVAMTPQQRLSVKDLPTKTDRPPPGSKHLDPVKPA